MRLLTQYVLNYPEVLESSRRSSECLLFFVISIDNDLITEKQLVPRKGVTEQLKGAKSNAVGAAGEQYPGSGCGGGQQRSDLHIRLRRRGAIPAAFSVCSIPFVAAYGVVLLNLSMP